MDAKLFDTIVRSLSTTGARRGVLQLLAALPLWGGVTALFGEDETNASRRRRRKKVHKDGKGSHKHKKHKKHCKPNSPAVTCAGKCGQVTNNCQKTVDCGSCACEPPCPNCQTCDASGQCGNLADGTACGAGLHCQDGQCVCTPVDPCTADVCGTVQNNCGQDVNCGGCGNPTPVCVSNVCTACSGANPCSGGLCCSGGQCVATCPACQSCDNGICTACANCCAGDTCQAGTSDTACGMGGGACFDCTTTHRACVAQECICLPSSCQTGCCQDLSCHIDEAAACGTNGGACINCGTGRRCVSGQCVCDSTSCPNGCCDAQEQCQVENDFACGTGGVACAVSCADNEVCRSGACTSCMTACPGCLSCVREINGSSRCFNNTESFSCFDGCTASSTCTGGTFCALSKTLVSNGSTTQLGPSVCGLSMGTGICYIADAC